MKMILKTLPAAVAGLVLAANASAQIVINEMVTGVPDWCEVANLGNAPVHVGGWTVYMNDDPTTVTSLVFPSGTVINPGECVLLAENATNPAVVPGVQRFTPANINWAVNSGGCAAINNAAGAGVELVVMFNATNLPPQSPAAPWTGSVPLGGGANTLDFHRRTSMVDTNTPNDWTMSAAGFETPGVLNGGQTTPPQSPLTASFTATATTVIAGSGIRFIDTSAGVATSWAWDFDNNGSTDSTAQHPTYVYPAAGTYSVKLTATNSFGSATTTVVNYVSVVTAPTVTPPYTQNFGAPLGLEWTLSPGAPSGRIQLANDPAGIASPLSGGAGLLMDVSVVVTTSITNTASLRVNLLATGGGTLKYYVRESNDEDDADDGVFLTNGVTTIQLTQHTGLLSAWTEFEVDLGIAAANAGMALTSSMQLLFRQRDNNPAPTDGAIYDDVRVLPPPVPDIGQANQAVARLDVNGGLNLNGNPALVGENGPFFASGNSLTLSFTGNPGQAYLLLLGPLNRQNAVFGGVGSLDVGLLGGSNNFSDVAVVLNGAGGPEFWDQFAKLDATGNSILTFGLPGFTPGTIGAFQAAIYTGGPSVIALTAAFEFTVTP